jgi:hypothetical protein
MLSMHPVTMRISILVAILCRRDCNIVSGLGIGSRLCMLILGIPKSYSFVTLPYKYCQLVR